MTTLKEQLDALSPANDNISEPFQPEPTDERWRNQDLWSNREGTVIRTGLYLKDRKEYSEKLDGLTEQVGKVPTDIEERLTTEVAARENADIEINKKIATEVKDRTDGQASLTTEVSSIKDTSLVNVIWDDKSRKLYQQVAGKDSKLVGEISQGVTEPKTLVSKQKNNALELSGEDGLLYVEPFVESVTSVNHKKGEVVLTGGDISFSESNEKSLKDVINEITSSSSTVTSVNDQTGAVHLSVNDIDFDANGDLKLTGGNIPVKEGETVTVADAFATQSTSITKNSNDITKLQTDIKGFAKTTDLGTVASKNVGNAKGEVPIVGDDGKLDKSIIPVDEKPSTDVPLTDGTLNDKAVNPVLKYRVVNDVIYISGKTDYVTDGQTSGYQIKVGNIPVEYMPKKSINGVGSIPLTGGHLGQGREKADVMVVGDDQTAESAQGAVMVSLSTEGTQKLTSGTWTFYGSYCLK